TFFSIMNIIVLVILFALMVIMLVFDKITINQTIWKFLFLVLGPIEFIEEAIENIIETVTSLFKKREHSEKKNEVGRKVIIGILIAIPILCVVLALLISADSIFGNQVRSVINTIFNANLFNSTT